MTEQGPWVYLPFVADTARRKRDEMDENTPYTPEDEDLDDIEAEFDALKAKLG